MGLSLSYSLNRFLLFPCLHDRKVTLDRCLGLLAQHHSMDSLALKELKINYAHF